MVYVPKSHACESASQNHSHIEKPMQYHCTDDKTHLIGGVPRSPATPIEFPLSFLINTLSHSLCWGYTNYFDKEAIAALSSVCDPKITGGGGRNIKLTFVQQYTRYFSLVLPLGENDNPSGRKCALTDPNTPETHAQLPDTHMKFLK